MSAIDLIDRETFHRYAGLSLPRHVAYPMPTWWDNDLAPTEAEHMRRECAGRRPRRDGSLYVHIPFCEALCTFCACNKVIVRKTAPDAAQRSERYVAALIEESRRLGRRFHGRLRQIHWGGGTPTYLDIPQIESLIAATAEAFAIAPDAEIALEIDPRVTTRAQLESLRRGGFNRVSMGVQDFEAQVQKHVKRVQPFEMVRECVELCRALGFASVNFDLIYGLPFQTRETVRDTVARAIELHPDRIAFYHYAQIPEKIAFQRGIDHTRLPDSDAKLDMFLDAVEAFAAAGYEFIGLDHFARPDEMLARAMRDGTIQRNFQGMTTGGDLDLIGAGCSAISHLGGVGYLQNVHDVNEYAQRIEAGAEPVCRGKRLTFDDRVRQDVLGQLYCLGEIRPAMIEQRHGIDFADYFARELTTLSELEADGLVEMAPDGTIRATFPLGRILLRNIAAVFDAYVRQGAHRSGEIRLFSTNA